MNFLDAMKRAYGTLNTNSFRYMYRPSKEFCIRVCSIPRNPETKRIVESESTGRRWWCAYEWGLHINPEDILADDWIVSEVDLK